MGTLSGAQIIQLVKSGKLVIEGFDERRTQPASYDLLLGPRILAAPLDAMKLGHVVDLTEDKPSYEVQPGQMVGVLSREKLDLPLDIAGRFGIRSEFARRGVIAFGGLQLDPGFRGRLIMNLVNVGPELVVLTVSEPVFSVEFQRLEEPAKVGYAARYQDQVDFPDDQYNFILSARTTSLAEIPGLRREIQRLSILIEELEERLPDPDEGLELRPEVKDRLSRSVAAPRSSLISIEDFRKRHGL